MLVAVNKRMELRRRMEKSRKNRSRDKKVGGAHEVAGEAKDGDWCEGKANKAATR